jgi:hypothetical protein
MVIDAMQTLSERGELSFTTTGFPSMGVFIDAINGRENAGGMYWILYINGTSSPVGASAASIEVGDVVEWKYKKGGMY